MSGRTIGRAELEYRLNGVIDSIAFGAAGTQLEGLLFAACNNKQRPILVDAASAAPHSAAVPPKTNSAQPPPGTMPSTQRVPRPSSTGTPMQRQAIRRMTPKRNRKPNNPPTGYLTSLAWTRPRKMRPA